MYLRVTLSSILVATVHGSVRVSEERGVVSMDTAEQLALSAGKAGREDIVTDNHRVYNEGCV